MTRFTVLKQARGVRIKGGRCVKPSKEGRGQRCTRLVAAGSFQRVDVAGANRFTGVEDPAAEAEARLLQVVGGTGGGDADGQSSERFVRGPETAITPLPLQHLTSVGSSTAD